MADIKGEHSSVTSQWPTQIYKGLSCIIENRLIGIVEDQHRQHATKILLKQLNSSLNILAKTSNCSTYIDDSPELLGFEQTDVYQIFENRMFCRSSTKHNKSDANTDSAIIGDQQHSLLCLFKQLSFSLDLLIWLMKYLWSDSFFISDYSSLGDKYLNRENVRSYSEDWLGLLQIMAKVSDRGNEIVENICENNNEVNGMEMNKMFLELSEIVRALLGEKNHGDIISVLRGRENPSRTSNEEKLSGHLYHMVDERLEGYEDHLLEIISNPTYSEDPKWLLFLERNEDLFLNCRMLLALLEVVLHRGQSMLKALPRLLKLSLRCMSQLPLPMFLHIHEWLWCSAERCDLYTILPLDDWDLSLNQTFNRLTNSNNSQLAVQVGCLILQKPEATLQRALLHVTQNQEAVKTLCEVVQSLPLLKESHPSRIGKGLLFSVVFQYLQTEAWTKTEELNIFNFVVCLCQESVFFDSPIMQPPVLSCDELLVELIFPSLSFGCNAIEGSRVASTMPLERALKLLNRLLQSAVKYISQELLFSSVMCLCEVLESNSKQWSLVKELCTESLQLVCKGITYITNDADANLQVMSKNLYEFHWSTKLKVYDQLKSLAPDFQKYSQDCLDAVRLQLRSLRNLEDKSTKEEELAIWDTILQVGSTSEKVAQECCEIIMTEATSTPSCYQLNHRSLTVALACHLERCTIAEWKSTLVTLRGLLSSFSMIPYSSQFSGYLPLNIHDISTELQLSQLLLSVIEVKALLKTACWDHIIKCYLLAMQDLLQTKRAACLDNHSRLFLAGQVFCHACTGFGLIPNRNQEGLLVLVYEILARLENEEERSKVREWRLIHSDMLRAARGISELPQDRDILVKKAQDLLG
ncbi:uncharacterized protein [Apostichopus japonicus]|uniref:uncharacterized protein isoform X2 n=1 Tax=Stichopus japonicus TaxID=307972 RepID=UPI003AB18DC3